MGNPHCITYVERLDDDCVLGLGPKIEMDPHFPRRVNAEFVEVLSPSEVRMRVWERGSGETLACGTGRRAVCVAGVLISSVATTIRVMNTMRTTPAVVVEPERRESRSACR